MPKAWSTADAEVKAAATTRRVVARVAVGPVTVTNRVQGSGFGGRGSGALNLEL